MMQKNKLILLLAIGYALFLISCDDNMFCKDVDCGMYGACDVVDGSCFCTLGYEFDSAGKCNSLGNTKFIGQWRGQAECGNGIAHIYDITIYADSANLNKLYIQNLGNPNCGTNMWVVKGKMIRNEQGIYTQIDSIISASNNCLNFTIDKTGTNITLVGDTLRVKYKISNQDTAFSCTAKMLKQ